jgi:Flp pilus assembly protein TadD
MWGVALAQSPKPTETPKYEEPPEEDGSLAAPKAYTFNPLQGQKEIATGDFHMKRGNFKGAAYRFREATLWDAANAEAHFKLGEASVKLKDSAAAREAFEKFIALSVDKNAAQKRAAKFLKK